MGLLPQNSCSKKFPSGLPHYMPFIDSNLVNHLLQQMQGLINLLNHYGSFQLQL